MAFFAFMSWFRPWWKAAETDYETVLARLTKDISSVQDRLVRVRQRERRVSVTLTLYAVVVWIGYCLLVWMMYAGSAQGHAVQQLKIWAPAGVGLMLIVSMRWLVRGWYRRVAAGEERHLKSLQTTRRKKIDEIKAATRYDHLHNLLEKYDERRPANSRQTSRQDAKQQAGQPRTPSANAKPGQRPQGQPGNAVADPRMQGLVPAQGPAAAFATTADGRDPRALGPSSAMPRQAPLEKTVLDRIADKILGVDPGTSADGPEQRYALICQVCFNHNGLCPREEWDEVQYICPRCGTFNSRRPSSVPTSNLWSLSPKQDSHRRPSPTGSMHSAGHGSMHGLHRSDGSVSLHPEAGSVPPSPSASRNSVELPRRHDFGARLDGSSHSRPASIVEETASLREARGTSLPSSPDEEGNSTIDAEEVDGTTSRIKRMGKASNASLRQRALGAKDDAMQVDE